MSRKEKKLSPEEQSTVDKVNNYLLNSRVAGDSYKVTDEGILVSFRKEFIHNGLSVVADLMRGKEGTRAKFDKGNGDDGAQRVKVTVVGILAECACYIAADKIPLEKETAPFSVDLRIFETLDSNSCYDCDLNSSVTVKTCGPYSESLRDKLDRPVTSWVAASGDSIRVSPEGKVIILCKWVEGDKILIMGWVHAADVVNMWSPPLSKRLPKDAIYYYEYEDNFLNAGVCASVANGAVCNVINPITQPLHQVVRG